MQSEKSAHDARTVVTLLVLFVVICALWGTWVVTPLKIVVVLLHELSHGIAAVVTGGRIDHIEINAQQGGLCFTSGGSRFLTLSAGYLGSMLWGGIILLAAARTHYDRFLSVAIGTFVLVMTVLYVRTLFGFAFSVVFSVGMIASGRWLPEEVNDLFLKTLGITSCLYAVLDIVDDVMRRPGIGSDADMLGQLTGIPGVVWGVVWIGISIVVTAALLRLSVRGPR